MGGELGFWLLIGGACALIAGLSLAAAAFDRGRGWDCREDKPILPGADEDEPHP